MFERSYFLVAPNFHGSTSLSRLFNGHPDMVSLGDTYPSNNFDQICGCGASVSRCPFRQGISEPVAAGRYRDYPHLLPDYPRIRGGAWDRWLYNSLPPRTLARMIPAARRDTFRADFAAAVHAHAGRPAARVFVDGVKSISRIFALAACGVSIDGVIQLKRNPGDYIQSTMKNHGYSRQAFVRRLLEYRMFHNRARRIGRTLPYLWVGYEDLAEVAEIRLGRLFRFLGVAPFALRELLSDERGRPWHFVGNATAFRFDGTIRPSRHKQTPGERMVTRALAGRYGRRARQLGGSAG